MFFFFFNLQVPASVPGARPVAPTSSLYPSLNDYMGLAVSEDAVRQHVPGYVSRVKSYCMLVDKGFNYS